MSEPENIVLILLREMRGEIGNVRGDIGDVRSDVKSLRADVASDMMTMEKHLSERINHLNRAVMEYHSSAVGHGILFTEIEERLRRVEQHLKLSPSESH